jgi:hypothetical protein
MIAHEGRSSSSAWIETKSIIGGPAMEVTPPSNPAALNHPTTDLHQPPRSLSRGGCHNHWHSLANCDHGDSINQVGGGPRHAVRPLLLMCWQPRASVGASDSCASTPCIDARVGAACGCG